MGLRINTNVQSLLAQHHLSKTNDAMSRSIEKMASGNRIVRAADDAAGLAISEGMEAMIRSARQNVRNSNDAISMIQTAEGGLTEISNVLIRFRELSIQAASDTVGDTERGFIDKEVQQLKQEVGRIATSTEFNGRKLLVNEGEVLEFQIGQHNNPELDRFAFDTSKINATLERMGLTDVSVATKQSAQANLDAVDNAIVVLNGNRSELGAIQNRLQATVNNLGVYDENLSAAKSQIRDADLASETAELTKRSILSSAGIAVLSQANQQSKLALNLLG